MIKNSQHRIQKRGLFYIAVTFMVIMILFPFIYMFSLSFMPMTDINSFPVKLIPSKIVIDNYIQAFSFQPLGKYIFNSFVIGMLSIVINSIAAFLASYALVRTTIKFKSIFLMLILFMTLLPGITIIQPIYDLYKDVGLLDSYWGIAILAGLLDLPMSIWFLSAMLKLVPVDFEESAKIDGANLFQILRLVYFPLVKHGVFSIAILVFINTWNQFLIAQILNMKSSHRTVVVALTMYKDDFDIDLGALAAASTTTILPIIILVFLFQKRIIENVLQGGIKG